MWQMLVSNVLSKPGSLKSQCYIRIYKIIKGSAGETGGLESY